MYGAVPSASVHDSTPMALGGLRHLTGLERQVEGLNISLLFLDMLLGNG